MFSIVNKCKSLAMDCIILWRELEWKIARKVIQVYIKLRRWQYAYIWSKFLICQLSNNDNLDDKKWHPIRLWTSQKWKSKFWLKFEAIFFRKMSFLRNKLQLDSLQLFQGSRNIFSCQKLSLNFPACFLFQIFLVFLRTIDTYKLTSCIWSNLRICQILNNDNLNE